MPELGTVERRWNRDNWERRRRLTALKDCPQCGKEIECWAETEEWVEDGNVQRHSGYGGAHGVCEDCGILIADCLSDGWQAFDLRSKK